MNPASIGSLFNGLSADLEDGGKRQPFPTRSDLGADPPPDKQTQLGIAVAGLTGLPRPQVLDIKAPQRLKQRLQDEGYLNLTPEEIQSDGWLPEYSFAAREMNFANQSKEFQGEKPGSTSIDQIFEFVDEWLSPRGLYRAAVELDLWWDFDQIGQEIDDWEGKLETWNEDKLNPRKLIDMLTGPLDDIIFPVLNVGLMFTGIGEVMGVARGRHLGVKGARTLAGTYRGVKGINFAAAGQAGVSANKLKGAADVARFATPSFVSRKLGNPVVMDAWRRNSAVIMGKKVNQQALRAGFTSNLEQAIDADRGGGSLDHFTDGAAGDRVYKVFSEPLFDWGVDIFLMPPNIWNPGTFSRPARAAVGFAQKGFRQAAENQDLLLTWDRPVRTYLEEMDPTLEHSKQIMDNLGVKTPKEAAQKFKRLSGLDVRETGSSNLSDALAQTFFDGDKVATGEALGFVAAMAGMDQHARGVADALVGGALHQLNSGTRRAFHQARNQLTAQLRIINGDNVQQIFDHWAKYGDDLDRVAKTGSRRADVFYRNRRKLEDGFLETADEAVAAGDVGAAEPATEKAQTP